jgi:tripartite-type tricarboxylate transporter receptor subunit TctC
LHAAGKQGRAKKAGRITGEEFMGVSALSRAVLAGLLLAGASSISFAQEWPSQPVKLMVGFGAGGGTDLVSRVIADGLGKALNQSFVVENKPGAGGSIAGDIVAHGPKDGYTALMLSPGHTVSAAVMKSVPYDPVKSFATVGMVANSAIVIVARKDFPPKGLQDLIALGKKEPGKLNYGTVNTGSTQQLVAEWFRQLGGFKAQGVTFRTTPEVITSLLRGDISYAIELAHAVRGQVESGELKVLAVTTPTRWPSLPDVPTAVEQGMPTFAALGWYGLVYPAGVPQPIVDKTQKALAQVLAQDSMKKQLSNAGAIPSLTSPAEFSKLISDEVVRWRAVAKEAGIQPM